MTKKIQFKITDIPPSKRENLENTKAWLISVREAFREKVENYIRLLGALNDLLKRCGDYAEKAALNTTAASELGAIDLQRTYLQPQVDKADRELQEEMARIRRQIGAVRTTDIQDAVAEPLNAQLQAFVQSVIAWLFDSETAGAHEAKNLAGRTVPGNAIRQYITYRREPQINDVGDAQRELNETIGEIEKILKGEPLFEF